MHEPESMHSLAGFSMSTSVDATNCTMVLYPGYIAVPSKPMKTRSTCRLAELQLALPSAQACAEACLAEPFCAAATWFAARRACVGRTQGAPQWFYRAASASFSTVVSAVRHCSVEGCSLQSKLDAICAARAATSNRIACRDVEVARNRRALLVAQGKWDDSDVPNKRDVLAKWEDFEWSCYPRPAPNAELHLACVDDRGVSVPCRALSELKANSACWPDQVVHDTHRLGCGTPRCLAAPGTGRLSEGEGRSSRPMLSSQPQPQPPPPPPPVPIWEARANHDRATILARIGYINCTQTYDEVKVVGSCNVNQHRTEAFRWLNQVWVRQSEMSSRPPAGKLSAAARALSWWRPRGADSSRRVDTFDPLAFVDALLSLHASSKFAGRDVFLAGDSTARQQAVSLCCLLRSGLAIDHTPVYKVEITKAVPFSHFCCQVTRVADAQRIARVSFHRFERISMLPIHRPTPPHPVLPVGLRKLISRRPSVLMINLGPWEYEDGCDDMHSIHDSLCNVTRPWILTEYANKWHLLLAAIEEAHQGTPGSEQDHSLVVLRTSPPRDFEGGTARQGGSCKRVDPLSTAELAQIERQGPPISSMRFTVMSQNLILLATTMTRRRYPWIRVLDAYSIARQRVDAHPSTAPVALRKSGRLFGINEDCQHYCLPGVPDVWNGRLLGLLQTEARRIARTSSAMTLGSSEVADHLDEGEGEPGRLLERWNFPFPEQGTAMFISGAPPGLGVRLQPNSGHATQLRCPLPDLPQSAVRLGFCSDVHDI